MLTPGDAVAPKVHPEFDNEYFNVPMIQRQEFDIEDIEKWSKFLSYLEWVFDRKEIGGTNLENRSQGSI